MLLKVSLLRGVDFNKIAKNAINGVLSGSWMMFNAL